MNTTTGSDDQRTVEAPLFSHLAQQQPPRPAVGRVIYLSRHGESLYNLDQRIGGDPALTDRGQQYARTLGATVNAMQLTDMEVWSSQLLRTRQTVAHIDGIADGTTPYRSLAALNELNSSAYDHLTYSEFERLYPLDFEAREADKLRWRYPGAGGESRVEPVMAKMDVRHNLVVICHQAVIRCIIAYLRRRRSGRFVTASPDEDVATPYIKVPLHTLIKVTFNGSENVVEMVPLDVACVDTHRPISRAISAASSSGVSDVGVDVGKSSEAAGDSGQASVAESSGKRTAAEAKRESSVESGIDVISVS